MAVGIIPARRASTRLPAKPLALVEGRPLIAHVADNAARAHSLDEIIVATDDDEIAEAVRQAGFRAAMTAADHPSGSDRIAEVARDLDAEIVVNIQGDEPEIAPATIDAVVELLETRSEFDITTAAVEISDPDSLRSPHRVKVVKSGGARALYFSRAAIPHARDQDGPSVAWGHLGIYAYRRDALLRMVALPPSPLEQIERLEQLRALEAGIAIGVVEVNEAVAGIDTPDDLEAYRLRRLASRSDLT